MISSLYIASTDFVDVICSMMCLVSEQVVFRAIIIVTAPTIASSSSYLPSFRHLQTTTDCVVRDVIYHVFYEQVVFCVILTSSSNDNIIVVVVFTK